MAARPSLKVIPGSPDTPQFVEIDCAGMDMTKTIEFLINDVIRGTIPVELTGLAVLTFIVPPGPVRNALADLNYCDGRIDVEGNILCSVTTGSDDSMELRYKV